MMAGVDIFIMAMLGGALLMAALQSLPAPGLMRILPWLRQILGWFFWKPRGFWLFIAVLSCAPVILYLLGVSSSRLRLLGWIFELTGLVVAIRGVLQLRIAHGLPSYRKLVLDWAATFPPWRQVHILGAASAVARATAASGFASTFWPDDPNETLENRIERLVKNQAQQREAHANVMKELAMTREQLTQVPERIARVKKELQTTFDEKIRALDTDGANLALVGLLLIGAGLTLSTMTEELVKWLT